MDVSGWFLLNVRLKQGCVMSAWLFNVYVDVLEMWECKGALERAETAESKWWQV